MSYFWKQRKNQWQQEQYPNAILIWRTVLLTTRKQLFPTHHQSINCLYVPVYLSVLSVLTFTTLFCSYSIYDTAGLVIFVCFSKYGHVSLIWTHNWIILSGTDLSPFNIPFTKPCPVTLFSIIVSVCVSQIRIWDIFCFSFVISPMASRRRFEWPEGPRAGLTTFVSVKIFRRSKNWYIPGHSGHFKKDWLRSSQCDFRKYNPKSNFGHLNHGKTEVMSIAETAEKAVSLMF